VSPHLLGSSTLGDDLVRNTIRLALGWYALALSIMLFLGRADWSARGRRGRSARWCWTFAWATYLVHVALAFHHYHHWSHTDAFEDTRRVSGVGEGIYASHLFTLVWTVDVAVWWLWPVRYARRTRRLDVTLHGFMLFIVFNATVVYGQGPIRWAGVALFAGLSGLALSRWTRPGDPGHGVSTLNALGGPPAARGDRGGFPGQ
jgi:hypothetical protein